MSQSGRPVIVWDLPVRLFHWALPVLLAVLYLTWRWNWMGWHALAGDALLALVLFRLLWGCFGSETARFTLFLARPKDAAAHLAHLLKPEPDTQVGHNPAGGWMVAAMLAVLLLQTLTGLYVQNDVANEGPLTEHVPAAIANAITDLHGILWNVLLVLAALHVAAILLYATVKRHDLVRPMVTGRKHLPEGIPAPRIAKLMPAALLFACAAGITALVASFL
ncbi:MAG TPA: cytochrome b/b6 domain-containing protein [Acetobacteraceae bacterium]|nr:cytochrome b/b6 domain-containing protein [Acetobacteraceae bacterium]